MSDNEEQEHHDAPAETRVGICNHICRWIGCCDVFPVGGSDGVPNLREGVLKKRACTDLPWLVAMFGFSAIVISTIWLPVISEGNVNRFLGASDYRQQTCGQDDLDVLPFGAWPDLTQFDIMICVANCTMTERETFSSNGITGGGYKSHEQVFWCIPDGEVAADAFFAKYDDYEVVRLVQDLYNYYMVPVYAIPLTFVFLFIFFAFVRFAFKLILRVLFYGLLVAIVFGSYMFMQKGPDEDPTSFYTGVAILSVGIGAWCTLMCCWLSLMEVVDVLEQASKAIMVMPQLLFVPIVTFPITAGIVFAWYYMILLMFSSGEENELPLSMLGSAFVDDSISAYYTPYTDDLLNYKELDYDFTIQKTFFVHLFWMLWGLMYIEYLNFMIVAGTVADWWLDRELVDNPDDNEEYNDGCFGGNCTRVFKSLWRALRYHMGTLAFASALVAAIQTIEVVLMYLKKQIEDSGNPFAKTLFKCVMAVVKCMECIIDRCNKNTLAVTAVLGVPFCAGCGKTLKMFFNNMALMGLGSGMISLMVYLANFIISLLAAAAAVSIEFNAKGEDPNSMAFPALAAFVISFVITKIMLGVWDASASCILVCTVMLKEWYPNELGKHLAKKANHVSHKQHEKDMEAAIDSKNEGEQVEMSPADPEDVEMSPADAEASEV